MSRSDLLIQEKIEKKIQAQEEIIIQLILEDEVNWLNTLKADFELTKANFFEKIIDGIILCDLANYLQEYIADYSKKKFIALTGNKFQYFSKEKLLNDHSRFKSRENISKFIQWCKNHNFPPEIMFESNDVIYATKESCRRVIICLLELARRFRYLDIPLPQLICFELQIERAQSALNKLSYSRSSVASISSEDGKSNRANKLKPDSEPIEIILTDSQAETVISILNQFEVEFSAKNPNDGTFMINGIVRFIRYLNVQFVIRVTNGWDTLESFLNKNFNQRTTPISTSFEKSENKDCENNLQEEVVEEDIFVKQEIVEEEIAEKKFELLDTDVDSNQKGSNDSLCLWITLLIAFAIILILIIRNL